LAFVLMAMTNEPMEVGMWSRAINTPTNFHWNTAYKLLRTWWRHETLRLCPSFYVSRICTWQILPKMKILLLQNMKVTCILLVNYNFVLFTYDINNTRFIVLLSLYDGKVGFTSFTWTTHHPIWNNMVHTWTCKVGVI
jgi:hypothetical protein